MANILLSCKKSSTFVPNIQSIGEHGSFGSGYPYEVHPECFLFFF